MPGNLSSISTAVSCDPIEELDRQFGTMCQGNTALEEYYREGCKAIRQDPKRAVAAFQLASENAVTPEGKLHGALLLGAGLAFLALKRSGAVKWVPKIGK